MKYALMTERLTATPDAEGLLELTRLPEEPALRKMLYLLWKAFSLVIAFSFTHAEATFLCKLASDQMSMNRNHKNRLVLSTGLQIL